MKETLINEILHYEWDMFHTVQNIGGIAPCQQNQRTFVIMRMSQMLAWTESILESYLMDLKAAKASNRNLMAEKYAHMMRYTSPTEYELLKDKLPSIDTEVIVLVNGITILMVQWAKDLKEKYPKVLDASRPIESKWDTSKITSLETYTKGELSTYGLETLQLSWRYFSKCLNAGFNYYEEVLNNTAKLYGYSSVGEADKILFTTL